jgi:hypothetical protein
MVTQGEKRSAAEVLAMAKAKTARASLCLDGDLYDEHQQLEQQLAAAESSDDGSLAGSTGELAARILDLEEQMREAEVEFVFKGMGRGRWRKLIADFPPPEDQAKQGAEFNVDEFPFHAMAASLVTPVMSVDDLKQLNDQSLDEVQFGTIWQACLAANIGSGATRPESSAARRLLGSERPSSASASASESVAAS